ncbi:hypothetical protein, partial [Moraxella sp.]|uniref:hypothetical protein n=1 Tax=Moraxella sp. TaxID=479 RepID=UPI002625C2FA
ILTPQTTITTQNSTDQVKSAIFEAGLKRGWIMTPAGAGVINGRMASRGYSVNIRINYSASAYTINYVSSTNLRARRGSIHRNYNRWVNNLDNDIQLQLAAKAFK